MRNFLKLLFVALIASPISSALAQDYSQYVTIGLPESTIQRLEAQGIDPEDYMVTPQEGADISRALAEIASTPEGLAAIQEAAANSVTGRVYIYGSNDATVAQLSHDGDTLVGIGIDDNTSYYVSPDTHQFHPLTIQRILYHEFTHLNDEGLDNHANHDGHGINLHEESRTVYETNRFMERYYGEPPRTREYDNQRLHGVGGDGESFPFNSSFNGQVVGVPTLPTFNIPPLNLPPLNLQTPGTSGQAVNGGAINNVINRFTSLGGNTSAVDTRRALSFGNTVTPQIQPFSFTQALSNPGTVLRFANANADYSGQRYRGGMGNGFALSHGSGGPGGGLGALSILRDATNGDGTFMGVNTGNVRQGTFNPGAALSSVGIPTTGTTASVGGGSTRSTTSGGSTASPSYPNYAPPSVSSSSSSSSSAPPQCNGTGPC